MSSIRSLARSLVRHGGLRATGAQPVHGYGFQVEKAHLAVPGEPDYVGTVAVIRATGGTTEIPVTGRVALRAGLMTFAAGHLSRKDRAWLVGHVASAVRHAAPWADGYVTPRLWLAAPRRRERRLALAGGDRRGRPRPHRHLLRIRHRGGLPGAAPRDLARG